jgi:hypothetical protein
MRTSYPQRRIGSLGSGLSGICGALLIILFFMPWFRACNVDLSGSDLAFGKDMGYGMTSEASNPGLVFVLLAGLAAVVVSAAIFFRPDMGRFLTLIVSAAGALALLLMVIVGIGFVAKANDPQYELQYAIADFQFKFGYFASVLAAGGILAGSLIELVMPQGARNPMPLRNAFSAAPPAFNMAGAPPPYAPPQQQMQMPRQSAPPPPPLMPGGTARLFVEGPSIQQVIQLASNNLSIGRSQECDIPVSDPAVSRLHARLRYAQGGWFIQDQGSKSGVLVNGAPVSAARLNSGDQICIGNTIFRIQL